MSESRKYRAPALEKGLEILELLAPSATPMPATEISIAIGRSGGSCDG
jgi:DNA-binding IclR family transcriptional regulator